MPRPAKPRPGVVEAAPRTRRLQLMDELRERMPKQGMLADHGNSPVSGIHLKCMDCQGGQKGAVHDCRNFICPLWPYRPYGPTTRPAGQVPTRDEYEDLMAKQMSDARKAALAEAAARLNGK